MENLTEKEKEVLALVDSNKLVDADTLSEEDRKALDSLVVRGLVGSTKDLMKDVFMAGFVEYVRERNKKKTSLCSAISFFLGVLVACIVLA